MRQRRVQDTHRGESKTETELKTDRDRGESKTETESRTEESQ